MRDMKEGMGTHYLQYNTSTREVTYSSTPLLQNVKENQNSSNLNSFVTITNFDTTPMSFKLTPLYFTNITSSSDWTSFGNPINKLIYNGPSSYFYAIFKGSAKLESGILSIRIVIRDEPKQESISTISSGWSSVVSTFCGLISTGDSVSVEQKKSSEGDGDWILIVSSFGDSQPSYILKLFRVN